VAGATGFVWALAAGGSIAKHDPTIRAEQRSFFMLDLTWDFILQGTKYRKVR
jgi:hypothetical protein